MQVKTVKTDIGVIVGRFQIHELHPGHCELIDFVCANHSKVLILIGSTPGILVSTRNPLDYHTRKIMIQTIYPTVSVMPIYDQPTDEGWSKDVDRKINEAFGDTGTVTIYGSRDSFIPHYKGKHSVIELAGSRDYSATEIRKMISGNVLSSPDFRAGVIYAAYNRHPVAYTTVDIAIVDEDKGRILLGRKPTDPKDFWRFPGGFLDPKKDNSLEEAAIREATEETGQLGLGRPEWLGSTTIDDWRYRNERDKIITNLFYFQYVFGGPQAGDDLDQVKWVELDLAAQLVLPQHMRLLPFVRERYTKAYIQKNVVKENNNG